MLQADAIITLVGGRYRLRERLGGSAYGVVWRALGPRGDVALKLVNAAQMARAHPDQRDRWTGSARKEIGFLQSLAPWDERHIVRLLDSGEHEGLPVMALELMAGDLAAHVAGKVAARAAAPSADAGIVPGMAPARILDWLAQINQALAKVHQYGWRYLDLKPANVLLSADGSARLADFGTNARMLDGPMPAYAGTASWQAPEQFFPGADGHYDTDARTDYFALGAMYYYLVTGGLPLRFCSDCGDAYRRHQGGGAAALLEAHGGQLPPTLHASEEALFLRRLGEPAHGNAAHGGLQQGDATWRPAAGRAGGAEGAESSESGSAALALLRALLAGERAARPANAVQVSRLIAAARKTADPAHRRPFALPPVPLPPPARRALYAGAHP